MCILFIVRCINIGLIIAGDSPNLSLVYIIYAGDIHFEQLYGSP